VASAHQGDEVVFPIRSEDCKSLAVHVRVPKSACFNDRPAGKRRFVISFAMMPSRDARFFLAQHTKTGKIYQRFTKYTKWPHNIPNDRKIFQMIIKFTNIFHSKAIQKYTHIGILGMKIYHLATLMPT
jgi:hypothetical protein